MLYESFKGGVEAKQHLLRKTPETRKTVLIAGGAGFLGSHLCDLYVEHGYHVLCLDDLSTGRFENIEHLTGNPNFEFMRHDVVDPIETDAQIHLIYNMACPASPPRYQSDPIKTFRTSVRGAENLLELAHAKGARILQASTSEVYGDPKVSPQSEDYQGNVNTMGPRACYDEGKRAAETLFHDYAQIRGIDIRVARIFNTYGPRMDPADGRVVSNFVTQALCDDDITIYGDGTQTRSFCYVDDLVRGLYLLMHTEGRLDRPVNLGNPVEFTMRELADIVIEEVGTASSVTFEDLPKDDPKQRRPDISRAKDKLGWKPEVDLLAGLRKTIPYFADEMRRSMPKTIVAE